MHLVQMVHPLTLFPTEGSLESVTIDIFRPLTNSKTGIVFILVIAEGVPILAQIVPLCRITWYDVAIGFSEHWIFKYGLEDAAVR